MHHPISHFQKCFDVYNFCIILNLFDKNKPFALSTHNRKCANKMHYIILLHSASVAFSLQKDKNEEIIINHHILTVFSVVSCLPFLEFFLSLKYCRSVLYSCFKNKRID